MQENHFSNLTKTKDVVSLTTTLLYIQFQAPIYMTINNNCLKCSQQITDPVCERCHIRQTLVWMRENDFPIQKQKTVVRMMEKELLFESPEEGFCIICQAEVPNICSYCFFYKTAKILKNVGIPKIIIENFLETFNYRHFDQDYFFD
jgi:hypothetical protein